MKSRLLRPFALAAGCAALLVTSTVQAAGLSPLTWNLNPFGLGNSWTSLAIKDFDYTVSGLGTANIRTRNQTGSATVWNQGNKSAIQGMFSTLYDKSNDSAIQFLADQNNITGINSGNYRPNPAAWNGAATNAGYGNPANTTSAPAMFAGQVFTNYFINFPTAFFAIDNVLYDLGSAAANPIVGGSITSINTANNNFGLEYSDLAIDGLYITALGTQVVPDLLGALSDVVPLGGTDTTATGSITSGAFGVYNRKMTLDFNVPYTLNLGGLLVSVTGITHIEAYATVPEPASAALAALATVPLGALAWRCRARRRA